MTPRRTSVQPVERSPLLPATSKKVTPLGRQIAVYAPLSTMYISSRSASSSARSSRSASLRCVVVSESNSLGFKRSILSTGIRSRRDRSLASSWSPSPERSKGRDEVMSSSLRVAAASSLRPKPAPMTIVWYVLRSLVQREVSVRAERVAVLEPLRWVLAHVPRSNPCGEQPW